MILEEATKEAYGYYASVLTYGSNKPIIAACELCGRFKIIPKHDYHTFCQSCSHVLGEKTKGVNCYMFDRTGDKTPGWKGGPGKCICAYCGKEFEVCQARIKQGLGKYCSYSCAAKVRTGDKNPNWNGGSVKCICLQCGKEYKVNQYRIGIGTGKYCSLSCHAKAQRYNARPSITAPEKAFRAICIKNNLPFKFVGNGALWLGNANPDFVHNTKKIVVEVFGDYWHSPLLRPNLRYNATVEGRTEQLKGEGYKCIVIWESDLMREDAEKFIMHTLYTEGVI